MNTIEAVDLIDRVQALWPDRLKALPDVAPLAWREALDDISHADARGALSRMARRDEWFALSKLVAEVQELRRERVAALGLQLVDLEELCGGDFIHARQEIRELSQRAADGLIDRGWYQEYLAACKPVTDAPRALQAPPGAAPARKPRSSGPGCSCEPCHTRRTNHACNPGCPCRRDCVQIASPVGMPDRWAETFKAV